MILSELVPAVILKATGKVTALTPTDTKYQKVLGIANFYIQSWSNTKNVDWLSLYNRKTNIGTVTGTDTFALPNTLRKISDTSGDFVQVINGTNVANYNVVPAEKLGLYDEGSNVCAQIKRDLVFRTAFSADSPLYGATIYVPGYEYAQGLANDTDTVPVDIPEWLVLVTAAEYIRNDITKQNQYPNIIAEANEMLERMIDDNDAQINTAYFPWKPQGRSW